MAADEGSLRSELAALRSGVAALERGQSALERGHAHVVAELDRTGESCVRASPAYATTCVSSASR